MPKDDLFRSPCLGSVPVRQICILISCSSSVRSRAFVVIDQPRSLDLLSFPHHNSPCVESRAFNLLKSPYLFRSPASTLTHCPTLNVFIFKEPAVRLEVLELLRF